MYSLVHGAAPSLYNAALPLLTFSFAGSYTVSWPVPGMMCIQDSLAEQDHLDIQVQQRG